MPWGVAAAAVGAAGTYAASKQASKGSKTTTSRPEWLDSASNDAINRARTISDRPYQGYDVRQRVAGLSGNESLAYQQAASLGGKYQPLIDRAGQQFSGSALNNYINPYREQVLDVNARKINQQFDSQLGALNAKRSMMDAFGSDRGTLLEGQLNRARAQALSDANTQGLSDAYDKASNLFLADRQGALQAAQTGMGIDQATMNAQTATGALERGVRQSQADFDYGQFIEKRDWSTSNLQPLLDAIATASGATGGTTSRTGQTGSTAGALAGLASTIAGSYLANKGNSVPYSQTGLSSGWNSGANLNNAVNTQIGYPSALTGP